MMHVVEFFRKNYLTEKHALLNKEMRVIKANFGDTS